MQNLGSWYGHFVLVAAHILEVLVMLASGLVAARLMIRRLGLPWALFGAGMLTFVFAEVGRMGTSYVFQEMMSQGMLPPPSRLGGVPLLVIALGAFGTTITLEPIRWFVLERYVPGFRAHRSAILVGLGAASMQAILTGLSVLGMMVLALYYHGQNLEQMSQSMDTRMATRIGLRVVAWWEAEPSASLYASGEALVRMGLQVALTAMMMVVVRRKTFLWFLAAMLITFGFEFGMQYAVHPASGFSSLKTFAVAAAFIPVIAAGLMLAQRAGQRDDAMDDDLSAVGASVDADGVVGAADAAEPVDEGAPEPDADARHPDD